ncbi:MAG: TetR/AcrR family transcriptional regulator [Pseudobdellovibrionaceae bacterium]|nr:TetR/AcrR family transcriptional regulator [Pseudobdellovibrionaceae bacterium]
MTYENEKNAKEIRIMEAAQTLFSRYGLKKTSIEEIAKSAGLGKGTVYLYFRSKEEIYEAVVQKLGEIFTEQLRKEIADVHTFTGKLEQYINTRFRFMYDLIRNNGLTAEVMNEGSCAPGVLRLRDKFGCQQIALLKQIIDDGVAAGEFETSDSEVSAMAIFVAMDCLEKPWSFQGRELSVENKVKALIELYLVGLKKRTS